MRILRLLAASAAALALTGLLLLDLPLFRPASADIQLEGGRLRAWYRPGRIEAGLVLAHGFGADSVSLRSLAREAVVKGYHVLELDFLGNGRSGGGLGYDNARRDEQARQLAAATKRLAELSGLPTKRIALVGHSMGARAALQAASLGLVEPGSLVLLGCQVNLATNAQASFFTGTEDPSLPWVAALGPERPALPVTLVSGAWDDILTPVAARLLFERLGGESAGRSLIILPGLVHNYEPYSPRAVEAVFAALERDLGAAGSGGGIIARRYSSGGAATARIALWILALGGFLTALAIPGAGAATGPRGGSVIGFGFGRWLATRSLLWIPSILVGALLSALCFLAPLPKPSFTILYFGLLGGNGIVLFIAYRVFGRPFRLGVAGAASEVVRARLRPLVVALIVLGFVIAFARSGWFHVFPLNARLAWLLVFGPLSALGFWIGAEEGVALKGGPAGRLAERSTGRRLEAGRHRAAARGLAVWLVQFLPFIALLGLYAALGSLSGAIGAAQGLVILAVATMAGSRLREAGARPALAALFQGFLVQVLVLPGGALFL